MRDGAGSVRKGREAASTGMAGGQRGREKSAGQRGHGTAGGLQTTRGSTGAMAGGTRGGTRRSKAPD
eukprot:811645-Alexandrium_andersonii.AAC.1